MNFVMSYEYVMQLAVSQLTHVHVHVVTQAVMYWWYCGHVILCDITLLADHSPQAHYRV